MADERVRQRAEKSVIIIASLLSSLRFSLLLHSPLLHSPLLIGIGFMFLSSAKGFVHECLLSASVGQRFRRLQTTDAVWPPLLFPWCLSARFAAIALASVVGLAEITAAEKTEAQVRVIDAQNVPAMKGKEVDWIYGDYLIQNDSISAVIGAPLSTRDANMTVRNVGASVVDLSLNHPSNDQLSAFTPAAGRYLFHDPTKVKVGRDGDAVFWQCESSKTLKGDGTRATVRYRLSDEDAFVEATVTIEGDAVAKVQPIDSVRADGSFAFDHTGPTAYCSDRFHRQAIGFQSTRGDKPPQWKKGRPAMLNYGDDLVKRSAGKLTWSVRLYPATSPIDLESATHSSGQSASMIQLKVEPANRPAANVDWVNRAVVTLRRADHQGSGTKSSRIQTDDFGVAHTRLMPGRYVAVATAIGHEKVQVDFTVNDSDDVVTLPLNGFSGFDATVTDGQGEAIPFKATIYAVAASNSDAKDTGEKDSGAKKPVAADPNFGPSSTRTFVKNCLYSVHGRAFCPLDPGQYEVHFSHGPEFNSVMRRIDVVAKQSIKIDVQLVRSVDTTGWVSTELHSHSSPSGDNTSDQFGRVENLLCEHLEFAPCTEHNRISSYTPHLEAMQPAQPMATCTGMELTGSLLPVNHQNAFPLHHHPHTQNGGGPRTSSNPVLQIERLAMWDDGSQKIVQTNHPNLHQIYGDLDVDSTPDAGFRGMLKWMDVVEVHPLETIFEDVAAAPPNVRRMKIPLFQWMQLINQGYRIPGVVNTDAHYNHHGSGWLRNWFACSTDDPAKITTEEMVQQAEAGHIIMSSGPFLSVTGHSKAASDVALPGDDLVSEDNQVTLKIRVQCPNWMDVNRVEVFINGRPSEEHHFTRKNSPKLFGNVDAVQKFQSSVTIKLDRDAHLIVATIGEGMTMEKVMGKQYGKRQPIAVSNPIFVDVDGNGFQHNHDELGLPLPKVDR